MKTVKSSTKKESPHLRELEAAVKATALYLSQWTQQQVHQLSVGNKAPYIWPIGTAGYIIGPYRVLNDNGSWQVRDNDNQLIHAFSDKLSAVFYCLCEHSGRFKLSNNIYQADNEVTRLRNDIVHYEGSVRRAKKAKRFDSVDIWVARLFDAKIRLGLANNELQKSLVSAKYIKYWE